MTGSNGMMEGWGGMMWGMGLIGVLTVVFLVLATAALVKYLFFAPRRGGDDG